MTTYAIMIFFSAKIEDLNLKMPTFSNDFII